MKKWHPQSRRLFGAKLRPRSMIVIVFAMLAAYYLLFSPTATIPVPSTSPGSVQEQQPPVVEHGGNSQPQGEGEVEDQYGSIHRQLWELTAEDLRDWRDPTDGEDPRDIEPGFETDGKERGFGDLGKLQHEKDMRKEWRHAYSVTSNFPSSNHIYGKTLANLENHEARLEEFSTDLRFDPDADVEYSSEKPVRYNPYPKYNSDDWKKAGHAQYFPCKGATGEPVEDLLVFKGRPREWPLPRFGSYDALNMDPNLCWERETRLGPYGLHRQFKKVGGEPQPLNFDSVNWGDLQRMCVNKNAQRFEMNQERVNEYLNNYPETVIGPHAPKNPEEPAQEKMSKRDIPAEPESMGQAAPINVETLPSVASPLPKQPEEQTKHPRAPTKGHVSEPRTAILLRSYTGKDYTENDKQTIRALVSELSLRTGGQYEVFLLVQVKDNNLRIFESEDVYQTVLSQSVPPEFRSMTILWNDDIVWQLYPKLTDPESKNVHTAQWLSVQKFSQEFPQFDFIWNWEMDFRFTGHHYQLLDKLGEFAKKQPRKGMWERNERWYIPTFHGNYDEEFRRDIEKRYGDNTIWGAPEFPFINPIGPKPPVASPSQDNYEWGVGEDADVITVSPMFNPINSNWVIANQVWGYNDSTHESRDIPRRTTIVTQSRVSKKLLNIMHVENVRGNHVASEMTPQTVALLHGLKAVYAPHPVFMDRDWDGKFLNKWFNPGENGECGGRGSPMGWGRERRYIGSTWYYRAIPPNRLYNNWMGWQDTGIGGPKWEEKHGRPCLPPVMLHQVKNTEPTKNGHETTFDLAYG
ncbi:unnamed protein product [Fusarium graminearum]|uniref:Chromosome 1, complete genome n=2 Tax=Gibberella zeae TaxID=5518 RepID=A0A1C3YJF8_GIBZE|nr:hypothetical protein HG531_008120 [Fusarium graminearum]PCD31560.1 hypothetical protein FGRA07_10103 [Fusarium graminearum]CAF3445864.1 unnamed protein product [Fusarium graminearum]CAF3568301.1 unnamed protein product [Fusarium graminearum]CAF3647634.1 unnamed protein product [Fusarium graminearum]